LKTNRDSEEIFDKAVDAIERSAVTQTKFVEDLLDITRIINGTIRLTMRSFSLNQLVALSADGIRPTAEAKSITVEYSSAKDEMWVYGDSERVQQIINNLLSNAVKFTPEGGTITLTLEKLNGNALISIRDTGQGISKEFLPRVFERYKQANNSTTNRRGGLGLGLAIVKHLVELHAGTIGAESEGEGKGSTFIVTIPIATSVMEQGQGTAAV